MLFSHFPIFLLLFNASDIKDIITPVNNKTKVRFDVSLKPHTIITAPFSDWMLNSELVTLLCWCYTDRFKSTRHMLLPLSSQLYLQLIRIEVDTHARK